MSRRELRDWSLCSSAELRAGGARLSLPGAPPGSWLEIGRPMTVLAALVERGVVADPFPGDAWRRLPGQGPAARNFANFPMPPDSPFRVPWWYRTEMEPLREATHAFLQLDGLNYRANVWLNGELVADSSRIAGAYRSFEIDVTRCLRAHGPNALALEVFPPEPDDLAITWVDWNPSPPDKNMGLWREVGLATSGPIALRNPQVLSTLADGDRVARLTIAVDVTNASEQRRTASVRARLDAIRLERTLDLDPGETRRLELGADEAPELELSRPRLWWPRRMGAQPLYRLDLDAWEGGRRSDAASVSFGIRRVAVRLTERGHALFEVNGRPLLVRGAGWASDVLLRHDPLRDAAQLDYVLDLGLNTVRFEGMIERDDFLARCDREGLLVIAGWCCCDHWEKWDAWKPEDYEVANESLRSQIRRLRNHASLIAFWYGSDFPPPPRVEEAYLDVLREERWPNAVSSSAADKPTPVTGPSGMKMAGPYDWVPPSYWLEDRERGGAFGFATEVSPGPAPPPLESLRRMLGPEHLWPPDDDWKLHAGLQEFHSLEIFTSALAARYGAPRDAADFAKKAQLACYEAERAMFEGYARNKYVATGVIQWMLCNGWPSLIWHLFDWYLRPGGGYYGAKKALGELHVQYSYDDRSVVVVNDGWRDHPGLELSAELRNLDLERRFAARAALDVGADGVVRALTLPEPAGLSPTHFLDLRLSDAAGSCVARNFYWLSTQPDVLDRETAIWFTTACSRHADFSALGDLAPATLRASFSVAAPQRAGEPREAVASERLGARQDASITLENAGASLAFFVELRVTRGAGGDDVLPILWDDNYVTLLPGERRTLRASWPLSALAGARPALALSGWNLAPQILAPNGAVVAAGAGS